MSAEFDALQKLKPNMDPNAIVYLFENNKSIAVDHEWMTAQKYFTAANGVKKRIPTVYERFVSPALIESVPTHILYKTRQTRSIGARAIQFDGVNDLVYVDGDIFSNKFTISGHVKTTKTNIFLVQIQRDPANPSDYGYFTVAVIGGKITVYWYNAKGTVQSSVAPKIVNDGKKLYLFEVIVDGNNLTINIESETTSVTGIDLPVTRSVKASEFLTVNNRYPDRVVGTIRRLTAPVESSAYGFLSGSIPIGTTRVVVRAKASKGSIKGAASPTFYIWRNNDWSFSWARPWKFDTPTDATFTINLPADGAQYVYAWYHHRDDGVDGSNGATGNSLVQEFYLGDGSYDYFPMVPATKNVLVGGTFKRTTISGAPPNSSMIFDNLRIHKTALGVSSGDVLYQDPFFRFLDGQEMLNLRFDDFEDGLLKDYSGNNTTITTVGAPVLSIDPRAQNIWVDFRRAQQENATIDVLTALNDYSNPGFASAYKIDTNIIPAVLFTDEFGKTYPINPGDGKIFDTVQFVEIDELDRDKVRLQQASQNGRSIPSSRRHLLQDLAVKSLENKFIWSDVLAWVNGFFLNVSEDTIEAGQFFIPNAIAYLDTVANDQPDNSPRTTDISGAVPTATVTEDKARNTYRYDFQLRLFQWKDVKFSPWFAAAFTEFALVQLEDQKNVGFGIPNVSSPNKIPSGNLVPAGGNPAHSSSWTFRKSIPGAQTVAYEAGIASDIPGYGHAVCVKQDNSLNGGATAYTDIESLPFSVKAGQAYLFSVYIRAFWCKATVVIKYYNSANPTDPANKIGEVPFGAWDDFDNSGAGTTAYANNDLNAYKRMLCANTAPSGAVSAVLAVRKFETAQVNGQPSRTRSRVLITAAMMEEDIEENHLFSNWIPPVTSTTYTWVKYAASETGANMSDSPEGMNFVGYAFEKNTDLETTNPADYTWYAYTASTLLLPSSLYFPIDLNPDAHLIVADGRILNEDEYRVDDGNPHKITLLYLQHDAEEFYRRALLHYRLYAQSVATGGTPSLNGYPKWFQPVVGREMIPAYEATKLKFGSIRYHMVNLESKTGKDLKILRKPGAQADFPYKDEVMFDEININDIVLVDGYFVPYDWIHSSTIKFPRSTRTRKYLRDKLLSRSKIYRLQLVEK